MLPFPGTKAFLGTRSLFLGTSGPFPEIQKGFPGAFGFESIVRGNAKSAWISQGRASRKDMHLTDVALRSVHLTGVHLTGVHLKGVDLTGVHLIGVDPHGG